MADKLKVYKDDEVIASAERGEDGKANATIEGLDANTEYETGDYKVAWENENGESDKTDVPGFKTNPIKVTGVSLDKESLTLNVGETETVKATIAPSTASDKSVAFTSSDDTIAKVDRETGEVTGVAPGTADIVATTIDGNKTATTTVTVTENTPDEPDNVEVDANENDADVSAE
ncbi:Ig domain-containing protein [Staphylococcus xylosus]|uniref:Ig-like domain-containing protein n=1 Tax=Staphylococcus xylosus TaxID=1288 RepID=UPI001CDCD060|nr:Ig-like domain-containing protein [Staphylococcus xylosus]UBV35727.1 Ig domain-containing protein [Staphylococcus xylosus]